MEQLDYNLLFRWFVGLGMDDAVWNHAVLSKNRERLLTSEVAQQFFAEVNRQAKRFMSDEHLTVDGTLIQAWASQKSFRKKDGSDGDGTNFHGQQRTNETHESCRSRKYGAVGKRRLQSQRSSSPEGRKRGRGATGGCSRLDDLDSDEWHTIFEDLLHVAGANSADAEANCGYLELRIEPAGF